MPQSTNDIGLEDKAGSDLVDQFIRAVRAYDYTALKTLFANSDAATLTQSSLARSNNADEEYAIVDRLPGLISHLSERGQAQDAFAIFASLSPEHKVDVLRDRNTTWVLGEGGFGMDVVGLIEQLDLDQQIKVLKCGSPTWGLLRHGAGPGVFRLLEGMSADQKTEVLSSGGNVEHFAREKQGGKLIKLMRTLDMQQQVTILQSHNAVWALRKYGQRESVNKMIAQIRSARDEHPPAPSVDN